jgi:hypothetical protein
MYKDEDGAAELKVAPKVYTQLHRGRCVVRSRSACRHEQRVRFHKSVEMLAGADGTFFHTSRRTVCLGSVLFVE